jgi:hypothetical protein
LTGGLGDDFLFGGPGRDRFFGQHDRNLLFGYLREDRFSQGPADLRVTGLAASDPRFDAAIALLADWVAIPDPWAAAEALFAPAAAPLPQAAPDALPPAAIDPTLEGVPYDVNRDGAVTPLDVLLVVNALNATVGNSPADEAPTVDGVLASDVNEDGQLTPLDALIVANWVNQPVHANGAGATALDGERS